ncbi:hypothetical protein [Sandaracinus amylolyticus]|uniref:hypothetical protein n=1 Tax=Sandaracinus amylolyticus TaxID=927083 RepID=UPI00069D6295|nr:hypothetical protein [Sandaracinus amylolyticus]
MNDSDEQVLGDEAEGVFEMWARRVHIRYGRLEPDRYGIDRWFEIPAPMAPATTTLDRRAGGIQGYLQIKGTRDASRGSDIALSVWDRFVKSDLPCFVLCLEFDEGLNVRAAFLSHVGPAKIPDVLRRLRAARSDDLHKKTHRQKWSRANAIDSPFDLGLVRKMRMHVGDPATYAARKAKIRDTAGYGSGSHRLHVRSRADDEQVVEALLEGHQIPVDILGITETRFGIESPEEIPKAASFGVKFGPSESKPSMLTIQSPTALTMMNGQSRVAGTSALGLPPSREVLRFEAPALRVDVRDSGTTLTVTHLGLERVDDRFSLRDLRNATNMIVNFLRERRTITLEVAGHPHTFEGGVPDRDSAEAFGIAIAFRWAAVAVEMAGLPDDIEVQPREILSQIDELRSWGIHTDRDATHFIVRFATNDFPFNNDFTTVLPAWFAIGRHVIVQAFASEAVPTEPSEADKRQFRLQPVRSGRPHVLDRNAAASFDPVTATLPLREELQRGRPLLALDDDIRRHWREFVEGLTLA